MRELQRGLSSDICVSFKAGKRHSWIIKLEIMCYLSPWRKLFTFQKDSQSISSFLRSTVFLFLCNSHNPLLDINAQIHFLCPCLQYKFWLGNVTFSTHRVTPDMRN